MPAAHNSFRIFLACALLLLPPASTDAKMTAVKTITYFSIGGTTAEDLDKELSNRGPFMKTTGARHPGATKIKFGGTITYVEKDGRCSVGDAHVTLSTRLILPRWKNRGKANKALGLIWDTLSSDIKRHEERHAEIARNHARDMERRFLALKPEANCEIVQARIAAASAQATAAHDKDQARFDKVEAKNFEKRMMRLLHYRIAKQKK